MTSNDELSAQFDLQSLETLGSSTIDAMVSDSPTETIVRHSEEIESLKTKIQERDEEILRLNKEIKKLRAENEWKDRKIEQLENKIDELEHDKADLETKLNFVQAELASVKTQVTKLREENKASREKLDKMSLKMEEIGIAFEMSEEENKSLKMEIKNVKETVRIRTSSSTEQVIEKASFHLAEMCSRIQAMMYQSVLPELYDDESSYKIGYIEEDIENEIEDAGPKEEAKRRWVDLKEKLKWDQRPHLRIIKLLKRRRNKTAHPLLNETVLLDSLKVMKTYGVLGQKDVQRGEELIQMWKTLEQQRKQLQNKK